MITGFCIYDPIFQWIQESIWTKDLVRVFHVKKNFRYLVVTWRGKSKKYHVWCQSISNSNLGRCGTKKAKSCSGSPGHEVVDGTVSRCRRDWWSRPKCRWSLNCQQDQSDWSLSWSTELFISNQAYLGSLSSYYKWLAKDLWLAHTHAHNHLYYFLWSHFLVNPMTKLERVSICLKVMRCLKLLFLLIGIICIITLQITTWWSNFDLTSKFKYKVLKLWWQKYDSSRSDKAIRGAGFQLGNLVNKKYEQIHIFFLEQKLFRP